METEPKSDISRRSKYFIYISILFVTVLMIANTVASKIIQIGSFMVTGGIIVFPISYIFGDVLTEVYGYKATRKVVWSGVASLALMSFVYYLVQILPSAPFWTNQGAYELILGSVPRIVLASIIGFFAGELSNSFVMSRMKVWNNGKNLWMRTIGSTIVGEAVDTVLFTCIAFLGIMPNPVLFSLIISAYILKILYEIIATPITYLVVAKLKKAEGMDVYDRGVDYNPFLLEE